MVRVPCTQAGFTIPDAAGTVPLPRRPVPAWGAEVAGGPTQAKALARYREVQAKYSAILGGREPHFVVRGVVLFGSNTSTANQLSESMRSAEAQRAALIGGLNICLVEDAPANRDS